MVPTQAQVHHRLTQRLLNLTCVPEVPGDMEGKKDELWLIMGRGDQESKSVYWAEVASSLILMKQMLASRSSEAVREGRPERRCRLRSSHVWGMRLSAHTLRNVLTSVYRGTASRESQPGDTPAVRSGDGGAQNVS